MGDSRFELLKLFAVDLKSTPLSNSVISRVEYKIRTCVCFLVPASKTGGFNHFPNSTMPKKGFEPLNLYGTDFESAAFDLFAISAINDYLKNSACLRKQ